MIWFLLVAGVVVVVALVVLIVIGADMPDPERDYYE